MSGAAVDASGDLRSLFYRGIREDTLFLAQTPLKMEAGVGTNECKAKRRLFLKKRAA
jgi:hypothetical protein